jgi:hypothetical protein
MMFYLREIFSGGKGGRVSIPLEVVRHNSHSLRKVADHCNEAASSYGANTVDLKKAGGNGMIQREMPEVHPSGAEARIDSRQLRHD